MMMRYTNLRIYLYRQTDGQTTCHGNTALCVASRGKNWSKICKITIGYMNANHVYYVYQMVYTAVKILA